MSGSGNYFFDVRCANWNILFRCCQVPTTSCSMGI